MKVRVRRTQGSSHIAAVPVRAVFKLKYARAARLAGDAKQADQVSGLGGISEEKINSRNQCASRTYRTAPISLPTGPAKDARLLKTVHGAHMTPEYVNRPVQVEIMDLVF